MRLAHAPVLALSLAATACGRDATVQLGDPLGDQPDASLRDVISSPTPDFGGFPLPGDGGVTPDVGRPPPFDGGSPVDFGTPPFDGGSIPDFGLPPFDGGAARDFGTPPPFDGGSIPDFGLPPFDGGAARDFGTPPPFDGGSTPDFGLPPLDGGFTPDFGTPPFDGGVIPPRDAGFPPDFGAPPPDGGVGRPDVGAPPDGGVGGPDFGIPDGGSVDAGPVACPGNTCASPVLLRGTVGLQTVVGRTTCATDNTLSSCSGMGGRDVVHQIGVTNVRRIVARANSVGGGFSSALSLRSMCTSPRTELVCDAGGGGRLAAIDETVDPGTYYLWLDGTSAGASGNYRVDVEIDPQDTCVDPIPVDAPNAGSSVEIRGDTTGARDIFQASCASQARSPDHVVAIRVPTARRLTFETLSPVGGGQFDTALHLREACTAGTATPELACDDDGGTGTLSLITANLTAGTYHLVVDGFANGRSGPYRLRISATAPAVPVPFPAATDTFQTRSSSTAFSNRGEFVEGTRSPMGSSSTSSLDVDARARGFGAGCSAVFSVSLNNRPLGNLTLRGTAPTVRSFPVFGGAVSPPYRLRYTFQSAFPAGCTPVSFDLARSTVTFN